jgi:hypothetical protein
MMEGKGFDFHGTLRLGKTRLTTATIFTDRLPTDQGEVAGSVIYHFNTGFY